VGSRSSINGCCFSGRRLGKCAYYHLRYVVGMGHDPGDIICQQHWQHLCQRRRMGWA
jgi:hypothetical protein